jgi:hypothetical protein
MGNASRGLETYRKRMNREYVIKKQQQKPKNQLHVALSWPRREM